MRSHFSPFNFPNLTEVIRAIEVSFSADLTKVVKALRGPPLGLYTIESDDYTKYTGKTVVIRNTTLPLVPRTFVPKSRGFQGDRPGILITIYDAYTKHNQAIPATSFDTYFLEMEGVKVLKQTSPQRYKNTRVLNGNRFLVLEYDKVNIDIGDSVTIEGYKFNIRYSGMQKYCYLCKSKHGEECASRVRFEQLKKDREGKLTHKVYADSSLRNVNQLALAANVACMSGGGIGQVINAIKEDEEKVNSIVIYAGANEITRTEDAKEFVFTVQKASEKLHELAKGSQVTLVLPTTPLCSVGDKSKFEFLKATMERTRSINVVAIEESIPYEEYHPTQEGTQTIINVLNAKLQPGIILAPDETTTDRRYSQVKALYKVGCRGCTNREYTPNLCAECRLLSQQCDTSELENIYQHSFCGIFHSV